MIAQVIFTCCCLDLTSLIYESFNIAQRLVFRAFNIFSLEIITVAIKLDMDMDLFEAMVQRERCQA